MSYDIYLTSTRCPTCGRAGESCSRDLPEPTYNLTPIFDLALTGEPLPGPSTTEFSVVVLGDKTERPRGLRVLSMRKASDTIPMLEHALDRLKDPAWRDRLIALEPPNKWGTLKDAVSVVERMLEAARENPEMEWFIR
jgi:hypothetical protein